MKSNTIVKSVVKSLKEVDLLIKGNKVNDLASLKAIENIFIKQRGFVFKMPKPNSPVISLLSGGLDTVVVTYMLLKVYKLRVYPLYIDRGLPNTKKSKEAALFFYNMFKKEFGNKIADLFEIDLRIPHPKLVDIVKFEREVVKRNLRRGVPLQPSIYAEQSFMYAKYLELTQKTPVRTIFGAWLYTNAELYSYESIAALRSAMLNLCVADANFEWQFTSLPMEKEMGFYFDKDGLIKIGHMLKLPLEKTWTCFLSHRKQCGTCIPCWKRKDSFRIAGINDKTDYLSESNFYFDRRIVKKVERLNSNNSPS